MNLRICNGEYCSRQIIKELTTKYDGFEITYLSVYNPFLGTGTTAIVAKRLNRRYIGSEIMDSYYQYETSQLANS